VSVADEMLDKVGREVWAQIVGEFPPPDFRLGSKEFDCPESVEMNIRCAAGNRPYAIADEPVEVFPDLEAEKATDGLEACRPLWLRERLCPHDGIGQRQESVSRKIRGQPGEKGDFRR